MYTLTRTPQKAQLNDSDNELFLEAYLDSVTVGYDSPFDRKNGSIIIPTVVTSDRYDDGVETQVKRRSGKLSRKQLTRRLLRYGMNHHMLTSSTPIQDAATGRVRSVWWHYFWTFFPNPLSGI